MNNHPITLHTSFDGAILSLWADAHQPARDPQHPDHDRPLHPSSVAAVQLLETIHQAGLSNENWQPRVVPHLASLPSDNFQPMYPDEIEHEPYQIRKWILEAAVFPFQHAPEALRLIQQNCDRLASLNVRIAPDTKFWIHAGGFARSLAARQRYLPSFHHSESARRSAWVPVFTGPDNTAFRTLTRQMPHAARCLQREPTRVNQRSITAKPSHVALIEFLTEYVDQLVRSQAAQLIDPPPTGISNSGATTSMHTSWAHGLASKPRSFRRDHHGARPITEFLNHWHARLNPRPNQAHQIGFQIHHDPQRPEQFLLETVLHHLHGNQFNHTTPIRAAWDQTPLPTVTPTSDHQSRQAVLSQLRRAAQQSDVVAKGLTLGLVTGFPIHRDQIPHFLHTEVPALRLAGFGVPPSDDLPAAVPTPAPDRPEEPTLRLESAAPSTEYNLSRLRAPAATDILQHWWALRFHGSISRIVPTQIVRDAKLIAQHGRVLRMEIDQRRVTARVTVSGHQTSHTSINVFPLPNTIRRQVTAELARRPDLLAALAAYHLEPAIERIFSNARANLIPRPGHELTLQCDCNDTDSPLCRHAVALHTCLAMHIDRHPETLLQLLGLDAAHITLNIPRTDGKQISMRSIRYPFSPRPQHFWLGPPDADTLATYPPAHRPAANATLLLSLPLPDDWESSFDIAKSLPPVYAAVTDTLLS